MKNIVLMCGGGMSTSILEKRMQEAARILDYSCIIKAYGAMSASKVIPTADIVWVGPQIRYYIPKLQEDFPHKTIQVIDMLDYGTMNGMKIMVETIKLLEGKD